jgi:hypothetical protein
MNVACEVALEAVYGLAVAPAHGSLALRIGTRLRVDPRSGDRDHVKSTVELALTAGVHAMAILAS